MSTFFGLNTVGFSGSLRFTWGTMVTVIDPELELGRILLFTHGIDLAKDIARNCGVSAHVDWAENTVTLTSQDPDLIALAVSRFNKLEEFYVIVPIHFPFQPHSPNTPPAAGTSPSFLFI